MATLVSTNAYVSINSVDVSDHVKSVTLEYGADALDDSAMGDTFKSNQAGLKFFGLTVEFFADFAANEIDATLFPLVGAAAFPIAVRADAGAIAATNPEYQGNAILTNYPIIAGNHGAMQMSSVSFAPASDLTRDVTP